MSGITININVNAPYVSLQKYAEITGIPLNTCKKMLADGRIIIRPKRAKMEKPEVNLVAMNPISRLSAWIQKLKFRKQIKGCCDG
ncbi:DNA-binding protein [Escherichia coli]